MKVHNIAGTTLSGKKSKNYFWLEKESVCAIEDSRRKIVTPAIIG